MAIEDITKLVEEVTGVPAGISVRKKMTREGKRQQAARVKRFLALPPQLQEGILKYGENIREAYSSRKT